MGSHCTLLFYPIKMSQKLVNLLLRLFVLAFVLLAESGSGSFNITRYTSGDVFQNINSSRSCNESGAKCVFDGENSPFCGINCCFCRCNSQTPTYLQKNGNCTSEDQLMSILKVQSTIQGCDRRTVLGVNHLQCRNEVLTTLSTENPGNNTLYLCSWKKEVGLIHFQLTLNLSRCEVLPNESLYLYNDSWKLFPPAEHALSKLKVEIQPDPFLEGVNKLFLKWTANIGKHYDGRILSLKLQCTYNSTEGKLLKSCVHFKKSGSLNDMEPTLKPLIKSTSFRNSSVQRNTHTEAATTTFSSPTTTFSSIGKVSISTTTHVLIADDTSLEEKPKKFNVVVIILAALAAALFILLACVAVIFILWRRSRRFDMKKEAKNASNPIYERGASDTLKMASVTNRNENEEEWPEYQPLVENTKPDERSDSLPGYRALSVGQRPTQGARSSNYLSLIKDEMGEGQTYQTLVKGADPQVLQTVNEGKIPDYQELEERTDSEDSSDSSHHPSMDSNLDYEDPPLEAIKKKINPSTPRKQKINDLSSDMHDYDEPEGIIVISDHEDNQGQAIKDNIDFHDYADPDDTDEDNTKCHVIVNEDASCYHDYDDPAE